ncbi:acyl-CoA dehydrogenase family protein [Frankia sp. EI5c]|uniref:acyl-CoA dehydrogenase family protein n=1 Tax=Frankia sp. EI5c TaxID=683316 RepID=UPI0007C2B542|nr:acyl-CoA dehydrogenase family protein [Frankia sp. EI5c]OAA26905.1 acyl-CoA dehydrogenase family protein [Frankia sp. EI5c]
MSGPAGAALGGGPAGAVGGVVENELSEEAVEYGRTALRAFEDAGGDQIVQDAEREPARRAELVEPVLAELGALDLDPRGEEELEAAAALCRAAGWWALPYPVAERLCRPADGSTEGLVVISGSVPGDGSPAPGSREAGLLGAGPAAAVAGLGQRWSTVTLDGLRGVATAVPSTAAPRYSAFVTGLIPEPGTASAAGAQADLALGLVLPCWTLLGMLDRAMDLARAHVLAREQFGQPLARFQGVQFQLTDAEVERLGVEELAKYALWSVATGRPEAVDDALALRLAVLEAADLVFRVSHQLHGAMGFCDETTLSWISRYSQPLRRFPLGLSATRDHLTRRVGRVGLAGPFASVPEVRP